MLLYDAGPAHKPAFAVRRWHSIALFVSCAALLDVAVGYIGWCGTPASDSTGHSRIIVNK